MAEPPETEPVGFERHVRLYFEDPTLWPVMIVLVTVLAIFGAAMILLALEGRSPFAWVALLLVAGMSVEAFFRAVRRNGRPGFAGWVIVGLWILSGVVALAASRSGVL